MIDDQASEQIAEIAARTRRLIEEARGEEVTDWSVGLCKIAASHLFVSLKEAGYEPILVAGTVRCDRPDPDAPEFIRAANLRTAVHYWIEVEGLLVDVTADQFNRRLDGKPFGEIVVVPRTEGERHQAESSAAPFVPDDGDWWRAARELRTDWRASDE